MSHVYRIPTFMLLATMVYGQSSLDALPHAESRVELRYDGLSVSQWHERLKNVDPKAPRSAAYVTPLIEIVAADDLPGVDREPFAAFLARVGTPARRVVPILAELIEHREGVKADYLWAARALALMGEPAKEATPALIDLMFDEGIPVSHRQAPVEALARIGSAHPDAIPALLQLLQYRASPRTNPIDAAFMRQLAAESIVIVGPEADLAAPLLIRIVRNSAEGDSVRRSAILALSSLRSRGAIAIAALAEELVSDHSPALRDAAAQALVSIGSDALPTTMQFLDHTDSEIRWRAALYVGELRVDRPPAILRTKLLSRLEDSEPTVRICAAESYRKLYGVSDDLIAAAIELLSDSDRAVRFRAKNLLIDLQPLEDQHLARLTELHDRATGNAKRSLAATLNQLLREPSPKSPE